MITDTPTNNTHTDDTPTNDYQTNDHQTNYFSQLFAVDVTRHLEKKGQFTYLSWPFAVSQLRQFDASATWIVQRFNGLPFLTTESGTFVEVAVTVKGITLSQIHPVLDARNKTIPVPSAFDINTSIQRCLVKAIALHGLGLNVYAGEDLPQVEVEGNPPLQKTTQQLSSNVIPHIKPVTHLTELLTANQLRFITRLVHETGIDEAQLLGYIGYASLSDIPKSEVNRIIKMLETNRTQGAAS